MSSEVKSNKKEPDETIPIADRLTVRLKEACALTGLSRATLYRMIAAKDLASVKVRGRRLIPMEELKRLAKGFDTLAPNCALDSGGGGLV